LTRALRVEYCRTQSSIIETGSLHDSLRRALVPYAEKWQADLIVLGVSGGSHLLRRLLGEAAGDVLRHTNCALYAAS
jgi:nucleotide-binding universal stress UspA family protein